MRKAPLFVILLTAALCAPDASAKNRDKAWEFGAFVTHVDGDRVSASVDNSFSGGIRIGYNFSSRVEAELMISANSSEVAGRDADFVRAIGVITGNFLTDRETRTIPFVTAGLGVINETRDAFTDRSTGKRVLESFDSAAVLTLGVGARTFFNENWAIRYEVRYAHHDTFEVSQDEFFVAIGATWMVGGLN